MPDDDCGCAEKRVALAAPQVVSLEPHEAALHACGIKRGHGEALRQVAAQLRQYAETCAGPAKKCKTKLDLKTHLADVMEGMGSIAEQLDGEAGKAQAESQQQLTKAIGMKAEADGRRGRSLAARARDAARGALCGWRGR